MKNKKPPACSASAVLSGLFAKGYLRAHFRLVPPVAEEAVKIKAKKCGDALHK
jgi:uncharacterized protein YcaQ